MKINYSRGRLAGFMLSVIASTIPIPTEALTHEECRIVSEMAGSIMSLRQTGVDMGRMVDDAYQLDPNGGLSVSLIEAAFDRPLFSTPASKQQAVSTFKSDIYRMCAEMTKEP